MAEKPLHEGMAVFGVLCHEPDVALGEEPQDHRIQERRVVGKQDGGACPGNVLQPVDLDGEECLQDGPGQRLQDHRERTCVPPVPRSVGDPEIHVTGRPGRYLAQRGAKPYAWIELHDLLGGMTVLERFPDEVLPFLARLLEEVIEQGAMPGADDDDGVRFDGGAPQVGKWHVDAARGA